METLYVTPVSTTTGEPRLRRAFRAFARWTAWWVASGLVVSAGLAASVVIWHRNFNRANVEACLGAAIPGILLATLLWRRRRESDGPLASMILSAGFWAAFWIAIWKAWS